MIPLVLNTNRPIIKIKGVDVSDIIKEISLTESIFEPVLRGSFVVFDTASSRLYQLTGSAFGLSDIEFSFHSMLGTSSEKEIKSKDFYVYKYIPGPTEGASNSLSTGYFGSKNIFVNEARMVSKYFDDTISNIVTKLCQDIKITCKATESVGKIKRVLPYDSVFSHVMNLSKQAKSANNPKDVDYIFFQDIDHDYYFKPLSSFKKKEVKWKYKVIPPTPDLTLEAAKYSVLRHSCEEFAPIENALSGMYSSEIISFDSTTGDYFSKTHVFSDGNYTKISNKPIVDMKNEPLFNDIAKSGVAARRYNKQRFLYDCSEPPEGQDGVGLEDDWAGHRLASMESSNQIKLNLVVPGNSEMKVGDLIEFRRPLNESIVNADGVNMKTSDIFYSGKFLVTEITHDIVMRQGTTPDARTAVYTMRVKAIKDSIGDENA
jgi:hypothetical protein